MQAMETNVVNVYLGANGWDRAASSTWGVGEVSLDITSLIQYRGEGLCTGVEFDAETELRYTIEIRIWARRMNWIVHFERNGRRTYLQKDC